MKPKEFIEAVLINEMKDIVNKHPSLSFLLISVGIEFLEEDKMNKDFIYTGP
jgi:hypothetical protein